ncbi:MAG TPA: hypothetical protein VGG33_14115 [Polyangia bacterium]
MERPIVVAVFDRGELQSVRSLAPERERFAAWLAGVASAALVLAGMASAAALLAALDFIIHGPTFFVSWLGVAAAVAIVSSRWARQRAGRYRLGADIDADAFAMHEVDFVRRAGSGYEVGLLPGMTGTIEQGGRSMPIEALTRNGAVHVPLPATGKVRVEAGNVTFTIARPSLNREGDPARVRGWRGWWRERRDSLDWLAERVAQRLIRAVAVGTPIAALATVMGAVPTAMAVTENDGRWKIPGNATPAEVEKYIRIKAQFEAPALHQCFDSLPLACQRAGYVGVGLSLSKTGEVVSHWVARTTYDEDCPVTSCMEKVVSSWTFQEMRERMTLVIPIQVKRTNKPLWEAANNVEFAPDAGLTLSGGVLDADVVTEAPLGGRRCR